MNVILLFRLVSKSKKNPHFIITEKKRNTVSSFLRPQVVVPRSLLYDAQKKIQSKASKATGTLQIRTLINRLTYYFQK